MTLFKELEARGLVAVAGEEFGHPACLGVGVFDASVAEALPGMEEEGHSSVRYDSTA